MQIWWKAHKDGVVIRYSRQPEASSVTALIHIPFVHLQASQTAFGSWRTGESRDSVTVLNGPFPVSPCGNWGLQRGTNVLQNETPDQCGSHLLEAETSFFFPHACSSPFPDSLLSSVCVLPVESAGACVALRPWKVASAFQRFPPEPSGGGLRAPPCRTRLSAILLSRYQLLPH